MTPAPTTETEHATDAVAPRWVQVLPSSIVLVAMGWISVAAALTNYAIFRDTTSLWIMTAGLVFLTGAAIKVRGEGSDSDTGVDDATGVADVAGVGADAQTPGTSAALTACLATALGLIVPASGLIYATGSSATAIHHLGTIAAAVALGVSLAVRRSTRLVGFAVVLVLMTIGTCLVVRASPTPAIDVWFELQGAAGQLRHGGDIYAACWPGNTDPLTTCRFNYMPWTSVSTLPSFLLLGDVRYTYAVCMAISAVLVWRLAGPRWGATLGALLLMQPRWFFLVEQTWNEPLLILGITVLLWGAATGRQWWAIVGLAFALACKQHLVILLPLTWIWPRFGPRRTLYAVGLAAIAVAPFVIRNPRGFYDDAVSYHLHLQPRPDSLSFYGLAIRNGHDLPFFVVPLATLVALVAVVLWLPRTDTGFMLGGSLVLLVFNIVNKASFFNHFSLVLWMLVLVLVTQVRARDGVVGGVVGGGFGVVAPPPVAEVRHPA